MSQELKVLLAARGNPDHGQDPDRPPYGVPGDQLVDCGQCVDPKAADLSLARKLVENFCGDHGLGGGNWVGGDVWADGAHLGCLSFNGRFVPGEQSPLVRDGQFVFGKTNARPSTDLSACPLGEWTGVLLSAVEASTDTDWEQVFALRPDLADRLQVVMAKAAPSQPAATSPAAASRSVLLAEVATWSDAEWSDVLEYAPELEDRLRAVLNRDDTLSAGPRM
ncbi:MAG: hypothetical protein ACREPQ_00545 [Rhodanobacter sp.]